MYQEVHTQSQSEMLAQKLYDFIYYHPHVEVKPPDYELCLAAGIIKTRHSIALSDCFLLAISKQNNATVLFRNLENEMKQNRQELTSFDLRFLEDY